MFTAAWWAHTIGWGSAVALGCGAVLLAVVFAVPTAFLADYPADIRQGAASPGPGRRRAGLAGGLVFLLCLLAGAGGVTFAWGRADPQAGFVELWGTALAVLVLFAVVDVLLVDWLVICTLRPRRIVLPGTEGCAGWRDYGFHLREQLRPRALVALLMMSGAVATAVQLFG